MNVTVTVTVILDQDNCAFDGWPNSLERTLVPLFASAGVNVTVRNAGHNGGWPTNQQLACAGTIAGPDADLIGACNPML